MTIVLYTQMVQFVDPVPYHLNVGQSNGQVCIGMLKPNQWDPSESCIKILLHAISVMLTDPQLDSHVDDEVNYTYHNNRSLYDERARKSVRK